MREAGFDYFENSRRATYANRAYCTANPMRWDGYSNRIWGLTACDGPGNFELPFKGETADVLRLFGARTAGRARRARRRYARADRGARLAAVRAGDRDSLRRGAADSRPRACSTATGSRTASTRASPTPTCKLETGSVDPQHGWVATDYLGIDQGPILLQAANYRDDFVWRYMRRVPAIRHGLKRAGFTGGWLG